MVDPTRHNLQRVALGEVAQGVSEAFYIPAALALIANYHTGHTRSRAMGFHQIAIYFGVIVGGFGGYAAADPNVGWRLTFAVCGVFGMLYAVPLVFLLRDVPRSEEQLSVPGSSPSSAAKDLFASISFILLVLYFTLPVMAGWCRIECPRS